MESSIGNIVHAIQLAVAPVFLLTAVATLISVMNVRLARVVDRRRVLNARKAGLDELSASADVAELAMLHKRGRLIYFSMFSAVLSAWLVCVIVAAAFLGAMFSVDVAKVIASLFCAGHACHDRRPDDVSARSIYRCGASVD